MTNREKQSKEMEVVRKSLPVRVGQLYSERFGEDVLYYQWDEENGFTFHWGKIPVVWRHKTHLSDCYVIQKLQGDKLTSYCVHYEVDENFQPKLVGRILVRESNVMLSPALKMSIHTTLTPQEEQLIKEIDEQSRTTKG